MQTFWFLNQILLWCQKPIYIPWANKNNANAMHQNNLEASHPLLAPSAPLVVVLDGDAAPEDTCPVAAGPDPVA